ncbi:MAG: branched-chain amino acid ABC transporter permease [Cyanobacteria bacterium CRU_2_1]|nr:branched-chain amino acid ABC transporter permease [Cyanobacteria bacterium RU_5_0]NJR57655.1 branched-chain amino acid ABC transporter permease [Cyanobacteria bacterium CRU_2_1]
MQGYIVFLVIFTAIYAVFGLGLNLQWGYTGLINFGHVAFMVLGAYTTVLLSLRGVPLIVATMVGAGVAALLGLLIGFATLRLRTDYLAIVTIGVSELLRLIALNEQWLTRGTFGIQRFPLPLANFIPTMSVRILMMAVLTLIVGMGYWRWWKWLRRQVKDIPSEALLKSAPTALGYVASLGILVFGIGAIAKHLKSSNAIPDWGLGLFLVAAFAIVIVSYHILTKRVSTKLSAWSSGLLLVCHFLLAALGLWIFGVSASAIYDYDQNPAKNGLMFVSVVTLALIFWGLERLVESPWGRILKAIREDEEVAKALGKNVFWYKLQSLMLGGAIAGIAGALYAWQLTTVFPKNFEPLVTFNAWTIVVLGGAGNNTGTLLGAAIFWAYEAITRFILEDIIPLNESQLNAFRIMVIGLLLMGLMVWRPQGILGKKEELTLGR